MYSLVNTDKGTGRRTVFGNAVHYIWRIHGSDYFHPHYQAGAWERKGCTVRMAGVRPLLDSQAPPWLVYTMSVRPCLTVKPHPGWLVYTMRSCGLSFSWIRIKFDHIFDRAFPSFQVGVSHLEMPESVGYLSHCLVCLSSASRRTCSIDSSASPFLDLPRPTLQASLSGTFLQTLPDLVTPLKGHSLSPRSCPPTRSPPSERFGY